MTAATGISQESVTQSLKDGSLRKSSTRSPERFMSNLVKVVEAQTAIIHLQSDVIDELFLLLMQHIGAEEADKLPLLEKINEAAKLRESIKV